MKKVQLKMDVRAAAAVRQILFESQRGYTNDPVSVPERIFEIREVITNLDDSIEKVVNN